MTYGDHQLWVEVEEMPPIVDHWPSQNSRVAIELILAPDSVGRSKWMALIDREVTALNSLPRINIEIQETLAANCDKPVLIHFPCRAYPIRQYASPLPLCQY